MTTRSVVIGNFISLFLEGAAFTVPSAGTVSKTEIPGDADPAWLSFPCVQDAQLSVQGEVKDVLGPNAGGAYVRVDAVKTGQAGALKVTLNQVSLLAWQLFWGLDTIDGSTTSSAQPFGGVTKKGWVKWSQKAHEKTDWAKAKMWCLIEPTGTPTFGKEVVTLEVNLHFIDAAGNAVQPL